MSVSVMTQVHFAHSVYLDNLQSYALAKTLEDINVRLLKAAQSEQRQGKLHDADVLKYEIELLESQIDALKQYGELQNALEQLNNAMGLPQYYVNSREYGVLEEPVDQTVRKAEEIPQEEQAAEAEELRSIYLDYIIEKIEKEEEEIQHARAESHQPEIDAKVKELHDSTASDKVEEPVHEEESTQPDEPPITPAAPASYEEHQENPSQLSYENRSYIDDILNKYRENADEESSSAKNNDYVELDVLIQKYGISEAEVKQSHEDNDEQLLPVQKEEGFINHSYSMLMDAISQLFARIKSILWAECRKG